jgi:hypothetical protein
MSLTFRKVGYGLALLAAIAMPLALQAAPKPTKITTPVLSQDGATDVSIDVRVTAPAGGTGLPGGFSLQWMTLADYTSHCVTDPITLVESCGLTGWYSSDDTRLCKASFSGKANGYNYSISAGNSVVVSIGDFLLDEGASTTCNERLSCGTTYVIHSFGHATNAYQRSDFSPNVEYSTSECATNCPTRSTEYPFNGQCTNTQGFWGTHSPIPSGNNVNQWVVTELTLGTVLYTDLQVQSIMNASVSGNGLISLAHQLVAAKLNILHGATAPQEVLDAIAAADLLIGAKVIPPVGTNTVKPDVTSGLVDILKDFNEGAVGPGHCLSSEEYERCIAGTL